MGLRLYDQVSIEFMFDLPPTDSLVVAKVGDPRFRLERFLFTLVRHTHPVATFINEVFTA